jgi:hypothetical protein
MQVKDIVRAGYPDADEDTIEHILWCRTAFPFIGIDAKLLYKTARRYYRSLSKGYQLCECCDRIATNNGLCDKCYTVLDKLDRS